MSRTPANRPGAGGAGEQRQQLRVGQVDERLVAVMGVGHRGHIRCAGQVFEPDAVAHDAQRQADPDPHARSEPRAAESPSSPIRSR